MADPKWELVWFLCKHCGMPFLAGQNSIGITRFLKPTDLDPGGNGLERECPRCRKKARYFGDDYRFTSEDVIREAFRQAEENRDYAEAHWDELMREHADRVVAVSGGEVTSADTLDDLVSMIDARGWPKETVLILNMSTEPTILVV